MVATYIDADPAGRSTGHNTRQFLVTVPAGDALAYLEIDHALHFVPSFVRITPLGFDLETGGAAPALNLAYCQAAIDEPDSVAQARIVWLASVDGGATTEDLDETLILTYQGAPLNGHDNDYFLVEIGRTQSVPK
jgi:hypothetical protein